MKIHLNYLQWLFFWLSACIPFASMAAGLSTFPSPSMVQNFPSTEPTFESFSEKTSDSQIITHLAQDARGLIWIGTDLGLIRYDGYRFRKFTNQLGDPFSLAGNYVNSLYAAPDGRLWVGTLNDGISIFDPASERFENIRHDEKIPNSLGGGSIWNMISDGRGGMWIATDQGLNHLPAGAKRFAHFKHSTDPRSLMSDKVRSLLLDKTGRLWVGGLTGLQRLAPDGKSFETMVVDREAHILFQAQDGKLWLGTKEHGAAWLEPSQQVPQQVPQQVHWLPMEQISHPWISGITQMKTGQIWLATYGGGIIIISPHDGQVLQTLRNDPTLPSSLAIDIIASLLIDRAGWLWVGTWGADLQRMNANNTMLRNLKHSPKRPNGLSNSDIYSVMELANGQLLVNGQGKGIDIFDRQQGKIGEYKVGSGQSSALPEVIVYMTAETNDGAIWVATEKNGMLRKLADSTTWVEVPGTPSKLVRKLFISRDGSLWAGTDFGVARWQPNQQPNKPPTSLSKQPAPPVRFETLADEQGNAVETTVNAFAEDAQGRVWIGTDNGLWLHEPSRRGLIRIPSEPKRPDGLISDRVLGLLFDRQDRLWVSTDKGLERLKSRDGTLAQFEHVNALLGLPGKYLGSNLLEDGQGRIWTEQAVIELDIASGRQRINYLTLADGMEIGASWEFSYAKTRDGLLFFGGTKGLAVIDPTHFKAYDYAPPLVVTEIKINGVRVAPAMLVNLPVSLPAKATSDTNFDKIASLTLQPAQRNFAIEFAALDYAEPKKNRYQYRLQGYDQEWVNTDADNRIANYGNLWPGSYTLQVRGSNRVGDWSKHELYIPIQVLPAWWQTWWFGLVLLLLMTGLIASLIQMRTRYLRQRQHELEQLVKERTGELRQKQSELVEANHELHESNEALNESHAELAAAHFQLQETQQQFILQEKMAGLGTLTAGIAHEINNPTNFIHVSAQLLRMEIAEFEKFVAGLIEGDEEQEVLQAFNQRFAKLSGNVDTMLNGTERIIAIVKDLRSFSRLDESARKTVRVSECLLCTLHLVRTAWLEKVDFITEFTDDPELECWPALLNQVFINLLLNGCQAISQAISQAIKAKQSPDGLPDDQQNHQRGKLWLRLHLNPSRDALQIVFEDNGIGIEYAIQSRIMEPFFTTKEVGSGTGTGLSTAFGIVQKHGGKLEFTSNPGAGSCFTVTLPLAGS